MTAVNSAYCEKINHTPCRLHMYKKVNVGDRVGRLLIKNQNGKSKNGSKIYLCECDCGGSIEVISSSLNSGLTQSCGCLYAETKTIRRSSHGLSNTSEYKIWCGMKKRCTNPKTEYYHLYGGRGISVCSRWTGEDGFINFYNDLGARPKSHMLDRIDCDKDYEPSNCRWVNATISARNTRMKRSNTSGHTGVSFHKATKKWQASIRVDGRSVHLGVYADIEDAVSARKDAEAKFNYYEGV